MQKGPAVRYHINTVSLPSQFMSWWIFIGTTCLGIGEHTCCLHGILVSIFTALSIHACKIQTKLGGTQRVIIRRRKYLEEDSPRDILHTACNTAQRIRRSTQKLSYPPTCVGGNGLLLTRQGELCNDDLAYLHSHLSELPTRGHPVPSLPR